MKIENSVAVVTGGAKGLGKAITDMLLSCGGKVAILDIDQEALDNIGDSTDILKLNCDITKTDSVEQALEQVKAKLGNIDILVNNAGILHSEPLINIMSKERRHKISTWQKTIDLNLTAPFVLSSYVAEQMIVNRIKGIIINISSISSKGNAGQSAYAAAKAGVEALTKVWAKELGGFGIRTAAIAPGFMDTESTHHAISEQILDDMKNHTPIKKLGNAQNIASTIEFVIENDHFSGKIIEVDGGLVI
ncbi:MAG: SDR family NAD(P)-dependent oxidoreductase [Alphaproteobacteria bacterium]